ncbi:Protein STICHEL-like 3 [Vitis vinifera]|uniref:Protein STICHEL-like 3 n=1 Tax=Vitis vinifera TaxID=29760 RepID=A0A438HH13_VITVI|nr:Protein STICHEL-like 3 [Vitis vinifera]
MNCLWPPIHSLRSVCLKNEMEEEREEYGERNVTRAPRNGCGIPWNWSRIHHRGKTFLDMAGRSLSCGLSDSRLRRGGSVPQGRDVSDMPMASDHSSASTKSDAEALPLLVEASGSQESTENAAWVHDYSGELGIFADNLLRHDIDSDLASEARSGDQRKFRGYRQDRHQNLTQKYMPRTFGGLVGQNLVAQALSNAVVKRKVGFLYVFYGPHGTGKTSCARIFARALNCPSMEHPSLVAFAILALHMIWLPTQYRVFIFDDCDTLSPDAGVLYQSSLIEHLDAWFLFWSVQLLMFCLISSYPVPEILFPKVEGCRYHLYFAVIATKEDLEIDKDALKLIASRSDGSLRDAEMTLEQLSLLGQRISVPLVQELVVTSLPFLLPEVVRERLSERNHGNWCGAVSFDVTTATVITDILAGSYDFTKERLRRKFFRRQALSKEDMEKLRQALKTLSEAEKQLRMSNDKLTWLTAALLQLAPDQQYMLPSSSADTSFNHSPLVPNNASGRDMVRKGNDSHNEMPNTERSLSTNVRIEKLQAGSSGDIFDNGMMKSSSIDRKKHAGSGMARQQSSAHSADTNRLSGKQIPGKVVKKLKKFGWRILYSTPHADTDLCYLQGSIELWSTTNLFSPNQFCCQFSVCKCFLSVELLALSKELKSNKE